MDAIVGESYVSRTHSDRNVAESDEITGRATRKKRTNASGSGSGTQRTNYGVSESHSSLGCVVTRCSFLTGNRSAATECQ